MSQVKQSRTNKVWWVWLAAGVGAAAFALAGTLLVGLLARTLPGGGFVSTASNLLALDANATWYVTRSAGVIAYLLLWFSTAWGLAVTSKVFDRVLHRAYTFDFHEYLSLLAIGFLVLHIVVLSGDQFMPYSIAQILVPFLSPYRPLWVGIGVIAFYLIVLVSATFYLRRRIGMRAFRVIHLASFVAYLGATLHGFFSGTDSPLLATQLMYAGTFLVIVFLTSYWLLAQRVKRPVKVG